MYRLQYIYIYIHIVKQNKQKQINNKMYQEKVPMKLIKR